MRSRAKSAGELTGLLPLLTAGAAIALTAGGCNTSGCLDNRNSLPLAGFYSYQTGKSLTIDSVEIGGVGAPGDTLLATARYRISEVYMPFRATAPSSAFYFRYVSRALNYPELYDTITFDYTSEPRMISEECGVVYLYHITGMTYTQHLIDSVAVTDSIINNLDLERIRIYFRTAESDRQ